MYKNTGHISHWFYYNKCAGERTRTSDPRITNALLYQLSYSGAKGAYVKQPAGTGQCRPAQLNRSGSPQAGWANAATAAIMTRLCSLGEPWVISSSPSLSEFSTTSLPRS